MFPVLLRATLLARGHLLRMSAGRDRWWPRVVRIAVFCVCAACVAGGEALAAEPGWDEGLAARFSGRLARIEADLASLDGKLARLPRIPIDDQGGSGGASFVHREAITAVAASRAIEVRWPEPAMVDLVVLVPARRYDARGLDASFGLPDAFTVELIDAAGTVVSRVGVERGARSHPVRRGHPFVYRPDQPVSAAGLRIVGDVLAPDPDGEGVFVHAWSEVFAFAGPENVALGGKVAVIGGSPSSAPWLWSPEFLVDGQTPLGLPEVPADEHRNVGWLSNGRERADEVLALAVDLGQVMDVDALRLLPARRPTTDLPSGFGFPRRLVVSVSDTGAAGDWRRVGERSLRNPGHNPVEIPLRGVRARHLRVEAAELWKSFEAYPAFFALSELEVLSGERNAVAGRPVRADDGMLNNIIAPGGKYWSAASLSDGYGPEGRLVPVRDWLSLLGERLALEHERHRLVNERAALVGGWRNRGLAVFAVFAAAGAFAVVALPIRYRLHARRELERVRDRIAGDLHDEVGSNLGSIQMFADLAEDRSGPSEELKRIQRIAAETVSAVRDIVWLLRPGGGHRIATVEHLRETASIMLESLDWKFQANEPAWEVELPEERTRHLFLFFREALHNILRHAGAVHVVVEVEVDAERLRIVVRDDGAGIDPAKLERPATLRALRQRTEALDAELQVVTAPGEGTRLTLVVPMLARRSKPWIPARLTRRVPT